MRNLFLLLLLTGASLAMAQWKTTTPYGVTINDIQFTDRYTGYAVFQAQGTGSCMTTNSVYKTIDEGKSWIKMNTGTTNAINAVHFVNPMVGWFAGNSSEIRKTTDGGMTWVQVSTGVGSGMNDIWFKDLNNGFVIGNNGLLRKSTNGGSTWQTIASGVTTTLRRIWFYDASLGFITCGNGQLLRTTNGGSTWTVITTGMTVLNDIVFTSPQVGYAIGGSKLYTSQDGGLSWQLSGLNTTGVLLRLTFPTPQTGYMIVDGVGIMKTTDAGNTWFTCGATLNGLSDSWKALCFMDENIGYLCGSLGKIEKTIDGGQTWFNTVSGFGQELFTVSVPSKDTAYVGSKYGKIYKTDNGGITYFQQCAAFNSYILKIHFLHNQIGFACSDSGRMLRTYDGGIHWIPVPPLTTRTLTDMHFVNPLKGFVSASGGILLKTNDFGDHWDSIQTGFPEDYRAVWFTNPDTGFLVSTNKIVRTYDGGLTWTQYHSQYASDLSDIVFTNDSLGYCAGGFGKFLYTKDAGMHWDTCNTGTSNAEVNEMWALNDSTLYFARLGSQYITTDSCRHTGSMSTACLANNWSMNSIDMTPDATWGYAAGGMTGVVHQLEIPEIIRTFTSVNAYCAGSPIFICYFARGFYGTGNVFTAELSDATGSFANPTVLATYTPQHMIYQSGIITATIPAGLAPGNYRVRVNASNPAITGPDNGYDIIIQASPTPAVLLQSDFPTACAGEEIHLVVIPTAGGLNPVYTWMLNGDTLDWTAAQYNTDSLMNGDTLQVFMQSDLACANPNTASSNLFIANIHELPVFSLGNDTAVCMNSTIQLTAPLALSYSWYPSAGLSNPIVANPLATITGNISYRLLLTDFFYCSNADTITIQAFPIPAEPQIILNNDSLAAPQASAWQWYLDGVEIPGATDQYYVPSVSGDYSVMVINEFGCGSVSQPYTVILQNIPQTAGLHLSAYPNPVGDYLYITGLFPSDGPVYIEILDVTGKLLHQQNLPSSGESACLSVPVNRLSRGSYLCRIRNLATTVVIRFIK